MEGPRLPIRRALDLCSARHQPGTSTRLGGCASVPNGVGEQLGRIQTSNKAWAERHFSEVRRTRNVTRIALTGAQHERLSAHAASTFREMPQSGRALCAAPLRERSISWMCALSTSVYAHRSRVAAVAQIFFS